MATMLSDVDSEERTDLEVGNMTSKAERLRRLLTEDQRTADAAQRSFLRAEDRSFEVAEREARRTERDQLLHQGRN